MYEKFLTGIFAVVHAVAAERYVAHHHIEIVVRIACFLKPLDLYVCLRIQLRGYPARNGIQLHTVQLTAIRNSLRHVSEKITRAQRRLQNAIVALYSEPFERGIYPADHLLARIVRIQHAPFRRFVFLRCEQGFEFRIFFLPLLIRFVKGLR